MKLIISPKVQGLINCLLMTFKDTEWSGPAFYRKIEEDKLGWTDTWELVGFVPLDLGCAASTEFDGKDFIKQQKKMFNAYPEFQNCYQGLIHSHHGLSGGAFFSGTDADQIKEAANKVGYPSLVVAHPHTGSPYAFAVSYIDQFNQVHVTSPKDATITVTYPKVKPEGYFKACLNRLKKEAKKKPKYMNYGGYLSPYYKVDENNQMSLLSAKERKDFAIENSEDDDFDCYGGL